MPLADLAYAAEDVAAHEPYGTAELGAPEGIESDGGTLGVRVVLPGSGAGDEAEEITAQIDVVGPDDYRSNAEGEAILADLVPGAYAVTATATGYDVAQAVIPVRRGGSGGAHDYSGAALSRGGRTLSTPTTEHAHSQTEERSS